VIDDDPLALDGMGGLLRTWGCRVVAARSAAKALLDLAEAEGLPDLVISDFHLSDQCTGIEAIEQLRAAFGVSIPAFLINGDIGPALLQQAQHGGYHLLHKPADLMRLRTMLNRLLKKRSMAVDQVSRP
jgi:CheY-like chemotaxis protein